MKLLAVCGFGVGSSMVLKMTLQKVCKDLDLEADIENTDLSSAKGSAADAVFTSQELADELKGSMRCPVYPIKRYMDKKEVKEVLQGFLEKTNKE